ncbi:MAG: TetR/AcrR family transcriptional regulator [Thermomicrobiales bacterium]
MALLARIRPLIEERGYDAVSVDAMAKAAGVSKATLYRVFPAKEAVRQALLAAGVAPERLDARDGRETLLDTAMEVFAAQGYAGATVDAIAQAAGMSKAGFYWHFESKEAIFAAVIAHYAPFATIERIVTEGEQTGDDPHIVLTHILAAVSAAIMPRFALFRTILLEAFQNPEMGVAFTRNVLGVVLPIVGGYLTRQMAAGRLRPMHPALAIQSLIGPLFIHLLTREMFASQFAMTPPIETVIAHIVTTFLDGALVRPSGSEGRIAHGRNG